MMTLEDLLNPKPKRWWRNNWFTHFLKDAWYWIRCHTVNRYHLIDIRHEGYDYGWIDVDNALLYAGFKLLNDYVEKERALRVIDWTWNDEVKHFAKEIRELYYWWNVQRPRDFSVLDTLCWQKAPPNEILDEIAFEDSLYKKDTEMLIRLVKIRECLWT